MSRYNLSRSQEFITVQDFNCVQMRVSGCNNHYKFVLRAGAKAKSVTNNLPILSVLWARPYLSASVAENCLEIQYFLFDYYLVICLVAVIFLRRREGEKF